MRNIHTHSLSLLILLLHACSDEGGTPLDLNPNDPILSGTEVILDFQDFGAGDTITESHGVTVDLTRRGDTCADAVIAFDSANPPGVGDDDLDLGTPNEVFGGPGVGRGGERGPFRNDRPLGILMIIQEDPTLPDDNPDPVDDCDSGGTVVFDFGGLSSTGVTVGVISVLDVDDQIEADGTTFRMLGAGGVLLREIHPPVTGNNGVASINLGPTTDVLRLEVDQNESVAVSRVVFAVPDSTS
ncbi:MAG TPA: hypothetical protein VM737_02515 [Gemmatimonadota bacterium]|nr:hypothetical protein [Gemmatimonadota bacterium]